MGRALKSTGQAAGVPGRFVWTDLHGSGRNVFAVFRRAFDWRPANGPTVLHLFADTRYRLRLNGEPLAYGPARFLPAHPEFDTVDLTPGLQRGRNVVTVEVNSFGAPSFESLPSLAGFAAWGGNRSGLDLATPGAWKALPAAAWDRWAPPWSFAQGPVEILDQRQLPGQWFDAAYDDSGWPAPVLHARQDNWGALKPRSQARLAMDVADLPLPWKICPLVDGERRVGFRANSFMTSRHATAVRIPYAVSIRSPRRQTVELALFWGPHFLNGEQLQSLGTQSSGNRELFKATFRKGWNLLYGEPESLQECWGLLVGLPEHAGLEPHSSPRAGALGVLRHSVPIAEAELRRRCPRAPRTYAELPALPGGWMVVAAGQPSGMPAREMGWDRPQLPPRAHARGPLVLNGDAPLGWMVAADAGSEFIGHMILDIEGPAGTVIDYAIAEVVDRNGCIQFFDRHHYNINSAERVVLSGGRRTYEAFHPRGGRFLQLSVRGGGGPVTIHRLAIRRTMAPLAGKSSFRCGDAVLDWAWNAGKATLAASHEDGWVDPWRERGAYVGDTLVEHLAARSVSADDRVSRRHIRMWGLGQLANGQIADVVPAWKVDSLSDYSLLWIALLHDYWHWTGDTELVQELWPAIEAVLASPLWREAPSGLWNSDDCRPFIDWAKPPGADCGENGVLNALRCHAHACAATLARAAGMAREARRHAAAARAVRRAFQALWDPRRGRYAACLSDGKPDRDTGDLHVNVLALRFGLAGARQQRRILEWLRPALAANHLDPRIELYFLYYALGALYQNGLAGDAENLMRNHYAVMRDQGALTFWECLSRGQVACGSQCHGWSCSPNIFLTRETLGVTLESAGNPDRLLIQPLADTIDQAEGVIPHPRGAVHVRWRVVDGRVLRVEASAPKGVSLRCAPRGRLAGLRLETPIAK